MGLDMTSHDERSDILIPLFTTIENRPAFRLDRHRYSIQYTPEQCLVARISLAPERCAVGRSPTKATNVHGSTLDPCTHRLCNVHASRIIIMCLGSLRVARRGISRINTTRFVFTTYSLLFRDVVLATLKQRAGGNIMLTLQTHI